MAYSYLMRMEEQDDLETIRKKINHNFEVLYQGTKHEADINLNEESIVINDRIDHYWEVIYPIGSVYLSLNPTSPEKLFGGKWQQISGYFLRMASDTGTGGTDIQTAPLPQHRHSVGTHTHGLSSAGKAKCDDKRFMTLDYEEAGAGYLAPTYSGGEGNSPDYDRKALMWTSNVSSGSFYWYGSASLSGRTDSGGTDYTGYSGVANPTFNNMPKYQNMYAWKRIA